MQKFKDRYTTFNGEPLMDCEFCSCRGNSQCCGDLEDVIEKLIEYEDTGLLPNEIELIKTGIGILAAVSAVGVIIKIVRKCRKKRKSS